MDRNRRLTGWLLLVVLGLATVALAGDPYMVTDIKVKAESSSSPGYLKEALGKLYFRAWTHDHGRELWATDPATGATSLVKDINPGLAGSNPYPSFELGGRLYIYAEDEEHGEELWWTDGTTTQLLADIYPGKGDGRPRVLLITDDTVYLQANHPDYGAELWKTDGTTTELVADLDPGLSIYGYPNSSNPSYLTTLGTTHYFRVGLYDNGTYTYRIWKLTETGGSFVGMVHSDEEVTQMWGNQIGTFDGEFYFLGEGTKGGELTGAELWKLGPAGIELVRDFHPGTYTYDYNGETRTYPNSGSPSFIAQVGQDVYFSATSLDATGTYPEAELFRMTSAGFEKIDIFPGTTTYVHATNGNTYTYANSGDPRQFAELNGKVLITANGLDGNGQLTGREIWEISGSTVTLVKDVDPGTYVDTYSGETRAYQSSPSAWAEKNGKIYFTATTQTEGREIFETDGTTAGTMLFADLYPGTYTDSAGNVRPNSSNVYSSPLGEVNGRTVFRARDAGGNEPWAIDWAAGTATRLGDLWPGSGNSTYYSYTWYYGYTLGTKLVFQAYTPNEGNELWVTDGTPAGTGLLVDLIPGARSGQANYTQNYYNPLIVGDRLFFTADDLEIGRELWSTDGTPGGTGLVVDLEETGNSSSYPSYLTEVGGRAIFLADHGHAEGAWGRELWVSDGTEAGTELLKDIGPGYRDFQSYWSWNWLTFGTHVNDELYFVANDGTHGDELWVTDGTETGTHLVKDIRAGGGRPDAQPRGVAHDRVYFQADDGTSGDELWRTDGTEAGTELLEIWPGTTTYHRLSDGKQYTVVNESRPKLLKEAGGNLYFNASGLDDNGDLTGYEIWKATASGYELLVDYHPGTYVGTTYDRVYGNSGNPEFLGDLADGRFLLKMRNADGSQLVAVDPTDDSLEVLETLDGVWLYSLGSAGGVCFFRGSGTIDGELTGSELWATDGTPGGLHMVKDLAPGTYDYEDSQGNVHTYGYSSNPQKIAPLGNLMLFQADDLQYGVELFVSDGTAAGTYMLKDINPGGRDYNEIYYPNDSRPYYSITYGGFVYFRAQDQFGSQSLWKTDGTKANTLKVLRSYYGAPVLAHGLLYFRHFDLEHGSELWRSDGTEEGTVMVADSVPGPYGSGLEPLGPVGDLLFLRGNDIVHGVELWAMEPDPILSADFFPDGSSIDWVALKPMEFTIRGSDWDGDDLTLTCTVNGQPIDDAGPGPIFTVPSGTNPVTATFQWDPQVAEAGPYSIEFTVTDGTNVVTYSLQIDLAGDTDGDGLPDYWETNGYTRLGEFVDLPNLTGMYQTEGADPNVPDIFVEIDYMENETVSHRPFNLAIQWVVQSFASRGINLHVLVDNKVPFVDALGPPPDLYDWSEYDNYKEVYFTPAHRLAFRYCLFAHDLGNAIDTGSGISRNVTDAGDLGASDFIVSLGGWTNGIGSQEEQAGTFMHELGHTLGRLHGGHEYQSQKPNYISIMNHDFQFGLLIEGLSAGEEWRRFDYSFVALPDIDERRPKESDGVIGNAGPLSVLDGYGTKWRWNGTLHETPPGVDVNDPLDWNGDGDTLDQGRMDLNDQSGYLTLAGSEDWSNLQYTGGLVGGGGIRLPKITEADEPTPEESREVFPEPPPNPNAPVAVATVPADRFLTDEAGTAEVPLSGVGSYDADGDAISWFWFEGTDLIATGETPTLRFAPGPHLVQLIVEDRSLSSEPVEVTFEVVVPVAQTVLVSPDPSSLWPPNNKLREVRLVVEQTDVTCEVTGVTADEEIDGPGAKNPDWELTDSPDVVKLRAERDGNGDGRVYTVAWRCVDAAGLTYVGSVEVTVPHDQGNPGADDGGESSGEESSGEEPDGADAETEEDAGNDGEDAADDGGGDDESAGAPQAVGGGDAPQVAGGGQSDGGDAGGDESGNDDDESGEEEDESGAGGDADTPAAPDDPSVDGAGDVGSQAGDTNGGQNPAGAGNDGPQGGIEGGELNAGG